MQERLEVVLVPPRGQRVNDLSEVEVDEGIWLLGALACALGVGIEKAR